MKAQWKEHVLLTGESFLKVILFQGVLSEAGIFHSEAKHTSTQE